MKHLAVLAFVITAASTSIARAGEKDEGTALTLSIVPVAAAAVAGIATAGDAFDEHPSTGTQVAQWSALAGMAIGPSFGHWYAGDAIPTGLVIRGTGIAMALGAVALGDNGHEDLAIGVAITGLVAFDVGVVYDLWTVRGAARTHNQRDHAMSVAPLVGDTRGMAFATTF
jgi:hypothetical protein